MVNNKTYFYSARQDDYRRGIAFGGRTPYIVHKVKVGGEWLEFTEVSTKDYPSDTWDDYIVVGCGENLKVWSNSYEVMNVNKRYSLNFHRKAKSYI